MALRNLVTDIAGIRVGHAADATLGTGVSVLVFDQPAVASVDIRGGGSGTRETALLDPAQTVEGIDAIVLSGGSAFGLDAASGVQAFLREQGRGFAVRSARVPIVPAAILFDLFSRGSDNSAQWGQYPPYRELGYDAAKSASAECALGSIGAGTGATTVSLKGGIGAASAQTRDGVVVSAIAAVNAAGSVTIGDTAHFWAAPFEVGAEFGGRGWPQRFPDNAISFRSKGAAGQNTTLAVVVTDAILTKAQCHRLAVMAQSGLSRAIYPVHTPLDGDVVFAAATGAKALRDPVFSLSELGAAAANVLARAVARSVYEAKAIPGGPKAYRDMFG